jgi:hypothetical protein
MVWKNLKQLSLADSLTSEHEALTELIDWQAVEHLHGDTHSKRRGNRPTQALSEQSSECSGF